jgi:hypothetical protein
MGDILTLIERAEKAFDEKKAEEMERKMRRSEFTLEDFRDALALRLGDTRCTWLRWPEGYGTAEALSREEGVNALRDVIANAQAAPPPAVGAPQAAAPPAPAAPGAGRATRAGRATPARARR